MSVDISSGMNLVCTCRSFLQESHYAPKSVHTGRTARRIALLISILLPSLAKARESANRSACLSNVRQIVTAFIMYTNDNKGAFPYCALNAGTQRQEDFVWWNKANIANIKDHGIGPYLNLSTTPKVLYCPSDDYRFACAPIAAILIPSATRSIT
jgi:hypothetical protein